MTHEEALTFVDTCKKSSTYEVLKSQVVGPSLVIVLLISSVVLFYIIHMWQTTRTIMVVPIMLTLVGLNLQCVPLLVLKDLAPCIYNAICAITNATSYIFALVVTIEYWKVDRLNAKTSSMLAQLFPYIG